MLIYNLCTYLHQAVHVAAQYGQTAFLNHIISKYGADFDAPDNDGRSALHWYYKIAIFDFYYPFLTGLFHIALQNYPFMSS